MVAFAGDDGLHQLYFDKIETTTGRIAPQGAGAPEKAGGAGVAVFR